MNSLIILCGYSFSGKTTPAQQLVDRFGYLRVSVDDINTERGIGLSLSMPITLEDWGITFDLYFQRVREALREGKTVIADAANHVPHDRESLKRIAIECSVPAVVVYVNTPLSTVRERWMKNRTTLERHDVREEDFESVLNTFQPPTKEERAIEVTEDTSFEGFVKQLQNAVVSATLPHSI